MKGALPFCLRREPRLGAAQLPWDRGFVPPLEGLGQAASLAPLLPSAGAASQPSALPGAAAMGTGAALKPSLWHRGH